MIRTVRTGRTDTDVVEVYDTPSCPGCDALLAAPHVLISHRPCGCVEGGHRTRTCLSPTADSVCGAIVYEPPHVDNRSSAQVENGPPRPDDQ